MKKFLLIAALLLARNGFAAYASGGNILQPQVKYNTSTGYLTLDIDPASFAGISVSAAFLSASESAALTNTASSLAAPSSISNPAFVATTATAVSKQLYSYNSSSATVKSLWVHFDSGSLGKWIVNSSSTAPADLATNGNYFSASSTTQVSGPWPAAFFLHILGIGAASAPGGSGVAQ